MAYRTGRLPFQGTKGKVWEKGPETVALDPSSGNLSLLSKGKLDKLPWGGGH